jgi:hypothetical protein
MFKFRTPIIKPQISFIAILLACVTFLALNLFSLPASSQNKSSEPVKGQEHYKIPKVSINSLDTDDVVERRIRVSRNSRYDSPSGKPLDQFPDNATSRGLVSEWDVYLPALPVAESDAIVLADVIDAKAFLSDHKTGAYSEFNVRVIDLFKDNQTLNGNQITIERQGAIVELPSGRTIEVEVIGQRMPQIGRRYVFFLKYNAETEDYFILTAYEIQEQKVLPLDTIQKFAVYENADVGTFLGELQAAIKNPPPAPINKKRAVQ